MNRLLRLGRWTVVAVAVLLLFWVAATIGGWSPDVRRLTTSVHGPLVADYRADSPQALAPLSPEITQDASRDRPNSPTRSPAPTPSGSATPAPTGSSPVPTLPIPTPSLPATPTLPIPTPTLPVVTPTLPVGTPTPPVTPPLPTPPPLP